MPCEILLPCPRETPRTSSSSARAWSAPPAPTTRPGPASPSPSSTAARWPAARGCRRGQPPRLRQGARTRTGTRPAVRRVCGGSWPNCARPPSSTSPRAASSSPPTPGGTGRACATFAAGQRRPGCEPVPVAADRLHDLEPHLAPGLAGGVRYPQDAQVMPALAAAHLLRAVAAPGVRTGRDGDRRAARAGRRGARRADRPRRRPRARRGQRGRHLGRRGRRAGGRRAARAAPPRLRPGHRAAAAAWSGTRCTPPTTSPTSPATRPRLQTSPVVEGTPAGPGPDRRQPGTGRLRPVRSRCRCVRRAGGAGHRAVPVPAQVRAMRAYAVSARTCPTICRPSAPIRGCRGCFHACGHEGAGIGLAPATGLLIAQALTGGERPGPGPVPSRPLRAAARPSATRGGRAVDRPPPTWSGRGPARVRGHVRRPCGRPRCPGRPSPPRCGRPASSPGAPPATAAARAGCSAASASASTASSPSTAAPNQRACLVAGPPGRRRSRTQEGHGHADLDV